MSHQALASMLHALIDQLSPQQFPQLYDCLTKALEEETPDPFVIAGQMLRCDRPVPFPKAVTEAIEKLFTAAFDAGNADALNDLGAQYYDGDRGFEQNYTKAVKYYQMAAKNGSRQAQENLGYCYFYGRDMPVDYEKAFHYFALGAFDGHLVSLYKIGDMYAGGYYVEKNEKEAFCIYQRCLDTMTEEAAPLVAGPLLLRLGKCYLNGIGVAKDAKSALICYQKAELYLHDMVKNGESMYLKSYRASIAGQAKAREILEKEFPAKQPLS